MRGRLSQGRRRRLRVACLTPRWVPAWDRRRRPGWTIEEILKELRENDASWIEGSTRRRLAVPGGPPRPRRPGAKPGLPPKPGGTGPPSKSTIIAALRDMTEDENLPDAVRQDANR